MRAAPTRTAASLRAAVGTNLEAVAYWTAQLPFVDVMKTAGDWISGDSNQWDNGQPLNLDANGWVKSLAPGQHAKKLMLRDLGDRYPAGQYVVRFKGEGIFKFQFAARVLSQKPGEIVLQVTPDNGGIFLGIEPTNPANYLRDIQITPYFSVMRDPAGAAKYTSMTLTAFFEHVRMQVLPSAVADVAKYRTAANLYGVRLISYEGGQHMVGILGAQNDTALSALFDAFNRDPRIKDLYSLYLTGWKQAGGELFAHFTDVSTFSKWGRWGALEYLSQPMEAAPKFDALQGFIKQNPVWWDQKAVTM